jgi:osmotically inducible lipoprotein OsmB
MPIPRLLRPLATLALAAGLVATAAAPAEAHGCRRLNKTQGAIVGGTGGAVLGAVLTGGVAGVAIGAAAGGIAGHEIARKKHHRCYAARRR